MNLYRKRIVDSIDEKGVYVSEEQGERREVDGVQYVKRRGGWMQPAGPDWHASESDALRAAAKEISEKARILIAQAERLREEADRGQG